MLYLWDTRTEVDNLIRGSTTEEVVDNVLTDEQRTKLKEAVRRSALSFLVLRKQRIHQKLVEDYATSDFGSNFIDGKHGARKRIDVIFDKDKIKLTENYPSSDAQLLNDATFFSGLNLFFVVDYTNEDNVVSYSAFL